MLSRLHITDKDRLLAAGLMAPLVLVSIPYATQYEFSIALSYTIVIFATFATGALIFSIHPLFYGTPVQKALAILFMLPSLLFFSIAISYWRSR